MGFHVAVLGAGALGIVFRGARWRWCDGFLTVEFESFNYYRRSEKAIRQPPHGYQWSSFARLKREDEGAIL